MRILALLAAVPLAACSVSGSETATPGSGTGTTRTYAVADFTGVAVRGSDNVDVRVGTGFSVRAEGPAKELDRLRIAREGDVLKVGRVDQPGLHWGGDRVTVFVTMPRIVSAEASGSGDLKIDRVDGQSFTGSVAGSGDLDIAALGVREAKFSVAGSGDITAKGTVGSFEASVAGSGNVDARGVKTGSADVSIIGSGDVRADVAGTAKVDLTGSGNADLGKAARCDTTKTGSGEVRCGR